MSQKRPARASTKRLQLHLANEHDTPDDKAYDRQIKNRKTTAAKATSSKQARSRSLMHVLKTPPKKMPSPKKVIRSPKQLSPKKRDWKESRSAARAAASNSLKVPTVASGVEIGLEGSDQEDITEGEEEDEDLDYDDDSAVEESEAGSTIGDTEKGEAVLSVSTSTAQDSLPPPSQKTKAAKKTKDLRRQETAIYPDSKPQVKGKPDLFDSFNFSSVTAHHDSLPSPPAPFKAAAALKKKKLHAESDEEESKPKEVSNHFSAAETDFIEGCVGSAIKAMLTSPPVSNTSNTSEPTNVEWPYGFWPTSANHGDFAQVILRKLREAPGGEEWTKFEVTEKMKKAIATSYSQFLTNFKAVACEIVASEFNIPRAFRMAKSTSTKPTEDFIPESVAVATPLLENWAFTIRTYPSPVDGQNPKLEHSYSHPVIPRLIAALFGLTLRQKYSGFTLPPRNTVTFAEQTKQILITVNCISFAYAAAHVALLRAQAAGDKYINSKTNRFDSKCSKDSNFCWKELMKIRQAGTRGSKHIENLVEMVYDASEALEGGLESIDTAEDDSMPAFSFE